jgi:hypothetical protein
VGKAGAEWPHAALFPLKSTLTVTRPGKTGAMLFCAFDSVPVSGKAFITRPDRRLPSGLTVFHLADFFAAGMPQGECNDFDLE